MSLPEPLSELKVRNARLVERVKELEISLEFSKKSLEETETLGKELSAMTAERDRLKESVELCAHDVGKLTVENRRLTEQVLTSLGSREKEHLERVVNNYETLHCEQKVEITRLTAELAQAKNDFSFESKVAQKNEAENFQLKLDLVKVEAELAEARKYIEHLKDQLVSFAGQ